jgi:hypothetical protein
LLPRRLIVIWAFRIRKIMEQGKNIIAKDTQDKEESTMLAI